MKQHLLLLFLCLPSTIFPQLASGLKHTYTCLKMKYSILVLLVSLFSYSVVQAQDDLDLMMQCGYTCCSDHSNHIEDTPRINARSRSADEQAISIYIENIDKTSPQYGEIYFYNTLNNLLSENVVPKGTFDPNQGWRFVAYSEDKLYFQVTDRTKSNFGQIATWNGSTRSNYANQKDIISSSPESYQLIGVDAGKLYFQGVDKTGVNFAKVYVWDGSTFSFYMNLNEAFANTSVWRAIGVHQEEVYFQWINSSSIYGTIEKWDGTRRVGVNKLVDMTDNPAAYFTAGIGIRTSSISSLTSAINKLKNHITGSQLLSAEEIFAQQKNIAFEVSLLKSNPTIIEALLDLISTFETRKGPLFMTENTKKGFPRVPKGGLELERVMLFVQQAIIDYAYTKENIIQFPNIFNQAKFETATYFPGAVDPPSNPSTVQKAKIRANHQLAWGTQMASVKASARRPTGCYLAPGSIATVTVPQSMVNKGYRIRVGAHSWDLKNRPTIKRIDRVSILYDITTTSTKIANPLGGSIYIEVPFEASEGIVNIDLKNVVRSPMFSYKDFHQTSLSEWQNTERKHPGPWTDFETDKFMVQVPTSWIYNFDDPLSLLQDWDLSLDAVSELLGRPYVSDKHQQYMQVDVIFRGVAYFPGYPMSNFPYNPYDQTDGNKNHAILKGPTFMPSQHFHEHGHQVSISKFPGEIEAIVNFLDIAVKNKKFDIDLNTAFKNSFTPFLKVDRDDAAEMRMVGETFRKGLPRNISNRPGDEVKYQHRGYAHYVDIVDLFGWCALDDFGYSESVDFMNGIERPFNNQPQDDRILRISKAAQYDLRPLFHFWGLHPEDPAALKAAMQQENLPLSSQIYDRLVYYKTLVPMDNAAFQAHTLEHYPNGPSGSNPKYAGGWYAVWFDKYNKTHADSIQTALQNIIDLYYPNGATSKDNCNLCDNQPMSKSGMDYWLEGKTVTAAIGEEVRLQPGALDLDHWTWRGPNGFSSTDRSITLTMTADNYGDYTASYQDDNGCSTSVTFKITADNNIDLKLQVRIDNGAWEFVENVTVCTGSKIQMAAHPVTTGTWSWTGPNGFTANTRVFTLADAATPAIAGTYRVTYTDQAGITNTAVIRLAVKARPELISIIKTDADCGQENGSMTINFVETPGRANIQFSIDGGSTYRGFLVKDKQATFNNLAAGTYDIYARWGDKVCPTQMGTETISSCVEQTSSLRAKLYLEGFYDATTNKMHTILKDKQLLPLRQPFNTAPWNYQGTEKVTTIPDGVVDWVLLVGRTAEGQPLSQAAGFINQAGELLSIDGTKGIALDQVSGNHFSIHHRSHLAILSAQPYEGGIIDFTTAANLAQGNAAMKNVNGILCLYAGDYDGTGIINTIDFNTWKSDGAAINQYLPIDGDGNGIINATDYNLWINNRSKVGEPGVRY